MRAFTVGLFLAVSSLGINCHAGSADAAPFIDRQRPDCGIQTAIDSLGDDGGEVILPAGRFELLRSLMLTSHVRLTGQGPGKTILAGKPLNTWVRVLAIDGNRLTLEEVPAALTMGTTIFCWPKRPQTGWLGYYKPKLVQAIENNVITIGEPSRLKNEGWISFGLCSVLTRDCRSGDAALQVADASRFVVGQAVSVGSGDGNANESLSFIREIAGNTLKLERPIRLDHQRHDDGFWRRPAVWSLFPLITCEDAEDIAISDLSLEWNIPADQRPKLRRYTLSPIHLFNARDSHVENVHVDNSFADGISVQGGENVVVRNCVATNSAGNGLHPGTGLKRATFESNRAEGNAVGLYFCWHNVGHVLRKNQFVRNGSGITGLGNPGDRENLIEDNLFAENRKTALQINGGKQSRNIIRGNTFRDNSTETPGRYPAILLRAQVEDARGYLIENNVFENTTDTPTQLTAIEEQNGERRGEPTVADDNVIRKNTFRNPENAAVVVVGRSTQVDQPGANVVRK
jgi:hypothetical protein